MEFKEDAEVAFRVLRVFHVSHLHSKKTLHKLRHLLESMKCCQMSHSCRMSITRYENRHSLQHWLASDWSESEMQSIHWSMPPLIIKIQNGFWLFGPVKHCVLVWFVGDKWVCISKVSRSYFILHLFSKHQEKTWTTGFYMQARGYLYEKQDSTLTVYL